MKTINLSYFIIITLLVLVGNVYSSTASVNRSNYTNSAPEAFAASAFVNRSNERNSFNTATPAQKYFFQLKNIFQTNPQFSHILKTQTCDFSTIEPQQFPVASKDQQTLDRTAAQQLSARIHECFALANYLFWKSSLWPEGTDALTENTEVGLAKEILDGLRKIELSKFSEHIKAHLKKEINFAVENLQKTKSLLSDDKPSPDELYSAFSIYKKYLHKTWPKAQSRELNIDSRALLSSLFLKEYIFSQTGKIPRVLIFNERIKNILRDKNNNLLVERERLPEGEYIFLAENYSGYLNDDILKIYFDKKLVTGKRLNGNEIDYENNFRTKLHEDGLLAGEVAYTYTEVKATERNRNGKIIRSWLEERDKFYPEVYLGSKLAKPINFAAKPVGGLIKGIYTQAAIKISELLKFSGITMKLTGIDPDGYWFSGMHEREKANRLAAKNKTDERINMNKSIYGLSYELSGMDGWKNALMIARDGPPMLIWTLGPLGKINLGNIFSRAGNFFKPIKPGGGAIVNEIKSGGSFIGNSGANGSLAPGLSGAGSSVYIIRNGQAMEVVVVNSPMMNGGKMLMSGPKPVAALPAAGKSLASMRKMFGDGKIMVMPMMIDDREEEIKAGAADEAEMMRNLAVDGSGKEVSDVIAMSEARKQSKEMKDGERIRTGEKIKTGDGIEKDKEGYGEGKEKRVREVEIITGAGRGKAIMDTADLKDKKEGDIGIKPMWVRIPGLTLPVIVDIREEKAEDINTNHIPKDIEKLIHIPYEKLTVAEKRKLYWYIVEKENLLLLDHDINLEKVYDTVNNEIDLDTSTLQFIASKMIMLFVNEFIKSPTRKGYEEYFREFGVSTKNFPYHIEFHDLGKLSARGEGTNGSCTLGEQRFKINTRYLKLFFVLTGFKPEHLLISSEETDKLKLLTHKLALEALFHFLYPTIAHEFFHKAMQNYSERMDFKYYSWNIDEVCAESFRYEIILEIADIIFINCVHEIILKVIERRYQHYVVDSVMDIDFNLVGELSQKLRDEFKRRIDEDIEIEKTQDELPVRLWSRHYVMTNVEKLSNDDLEWLLYQELRKMYEPYHIITSKIMKFRR